MWGPSSILGRRTLAVLRRLGWSLATLLVLSVVTFGALNLGESPTKLARNAIGHQTTPVQVRAFVRAHDLGAPVTVRYVRWLSQFVRGNWGYSYVTQRPIRPDVVPRLERTTILALASQAISLPLSLALGLFMARRWGRATDVVAGAMLVFVSAMPEFVVGIALVTVLGVELGVLPIDSSGISFGGTSAELQAYVLPTLTLVITSLPFIGRITRAAARESLGAPYVQAAVLHGLGRRTIVWDHAMRNAAVPVINAVAINLIYMLGGVVVVENLFGFPGVGQQLVQAIGQADVVTVQAVALAMGAMFIVVSLVADLLVIYFNPRLRGTVAR